MTARAAAGSTVATSTRSISTPKPFWTQAMETRVGIVPLPVYVLLLALIAAFAVRGKISGEVTVMIAVLVAGASPAPRSAGGSRCCGRSADRPW